MKLLGGRYFPTGGFLQYLAHFPCWAHISNSVQDTDRPIFVGVSGSCVNAKVAQIQAEANTYAKLALRKRKIVEFSAT